MCKDHPLHRCSFLSESSFPTVKNFSRHQKLLLLSWYIELVDGSLPLSAIVFIYIISIHGVLSYWLVYYTMWHLRNINLKRINQDWYIYVVTYHVMCEYEEYACCKILFHVCFNFACYIWFWGQRVRVSFILLFVFIACKALQLQLLPKLLLLLLRRDHILFLLYNSIILINLFLFYSSTPSSSIIIIHLYLPSSLLSNIKLPHMVPSTSTLYFFMHWWHFAPPSNVINVTNGGLETYRT